MTSPAADPGAPTPQLPAEATVDGEATDQGGVRDGIDALRVTDWYGENVAGTTAPLTFRLIAGGRSNLTYEVTDAAGHRSVLRRPPTGHLLPTAHDMAREHRLITAMGSGGVPVPDALGLCTDPEVNGAPFYVMSFVDGWILRDAAQAEEALTEQERGRAAESLVETLARLHAVDPDAVGLGDLARREGYIPRQLKRWYGQYQAARDTQNGPDVADIDAVHDLLVARIPEQGPASVVHGDYRLDNTVIGSDLRVAAVLDWELCTLGDPLADVGGLLAYWTQPGEESPLGHSGPTAAAGFPSRARVAEMYGAASGRDLAELDFYLAFAYWKLACILEGVYTRYLAGAMGDADFDFGFYPAAITALATRARSAVDGLS